MLYPVGAVIATAAYFAMGHPSGLFNLIGISSPVLIVVAVRIHKPEHSGPWYLFAARRWANG